MTIPDVPECEIQIDDAWRQVSLAEAHARHSSAIKRCPVCHGRVSIHVNRTAQGGLWLQHRKAHAGCSLMPALFTGQVITTPPSPRLRYVARRVPVMCH